MLDPSKTNLLVVRCYFCELFESNVDFFFHSQNKDGKDEDFVLLWSIAI